MNFLNYILFYLFIFPLSLFPLRVLYIVSDFLYFMMYRVFKYRLKIIIDNLRHSFPEKNEKEIQKIAKLFYKNFCDQMIESLKSFSISKKELEKRFKFINPELIDKYYHQGKSVVLAASHYGNWEWSGTLLGAITSLKVLGAYSPLKNKFFDKKIKSSRSQFGSILLSSKEIARVIDANKNIPSLIGLIADQSPSNYRKSYWMNFLNQATPIFAGPEKTALKYNLPIVFAKVDKVKRGYYTLVFEIVRDNENTLNEVGDITRVHSQMLEKCIKDKPELWLWSHRRWKNKHFYYTEPNLIIIDKI